MKERAMENSPFIKNSEYVIKYRYERKCNVMEHNRKKIKIVGNKNCLVQGNSNKNCQLSFFQ